MKQQIYQVYLGKPSEQEQYRMERVAALALASGCEYLFIGDAPLVDSKAVKFMDVAEYLWRHEELARLLERSHFSDKPEKNKSDMIRLHYGSNKPCATYVDADCLLYACPVAKGTRPHFATRGGALDYFLFYTGNTIWLGNFLDTLIEKTGNVRSCNQVFAWLNSIGKGFVPEIPPTFYRHGFGVKVAA